tara:strand:+ start:48 stop:503 length:456 start_codon:yes stop_codon:yes gene_type:complete
MNIIKAIQNIMALLFKDSSKEKVLLDTISTLKKQALYSHTQTKDVEHKLWEAQGFITTLETSLEESTRTINALNLAIDMRETERIKEHEDELLLVKKDLTDKVAEINLWMQKATLLQSNVDELEVEIDELEVEIDASIEVLQRFGESLRKN